MSTFPYGVSLHVTVYIKPSDVNAFVAEFKAIYDIVAAEPECTYFEVFQSPDEPGVFHWVENWNQTTEWLMQVRSIPKGVVTVETTTQTSPPICSLKRLTVSFLSRISSQRNITNRTLLLRNPCTPSLVALRYSSVLSRKIGLGLKP